MQINLDIMKRFAPLIVSAAVYLALMGALVHFQQQASVRVRSIEEEYAKNQALLNGIRSAKPRPSKDDAERYRVDREALDKTYDELMASVANLRGAVIEGEAMPPTDFYTYLIDIVGKFTNSAVKTNVAIPKNFNFGFGYYEENLPGKNKTPDEAKSLTARLAKQLKICEAAGAILVGAGTEELVAIRRIDIEGVDASGLLSGTIAKGPNDLYSMMPFELEFNCWAPVLQDVLNAFAKSSQIWIVRSVTVKTVDEKNVAMAATSGSSQFGGGMEPVMAEPRPRSTSRFGPAAPTPPQPPKMVEAVAGGGASTNTLVMQDNKKRKRLNVVMRVDYIEFAPATNQAPSVASAPTSTVAGN